jgi:hypothetical protein
MLIFHVLVLPSQPTWDSDFHRCLDGASVGSPKPTIVLKAEDVVTCRMSYESSLNLVFTPSNNISVRCNGLSKGRG